MDHDHEEQLERILENRRRRGVLGKAELPAHLNNATQTSTNNLLDTLTSSAVLETSPIAKDAYAPRYTSSSPSFLQGSSPLPDKDAASQRPFFGRSDYPAAAKNVAPPLFSAAPSAASNRRYGGAGNSNPGPDWRNSSAATVGVRASSPLSFRPSAAGAPPGNSFSPLGGNARSPSYVPSIVYTPRQSAPWSSQDRQPSVTPKWEPPLKFSAQRPPLSSPLSSPRSNHRLDGAAGLGTTTSDWRPWHADPGGRFGARYGGGNSPGYYNSHSTLQQRESHNAPGWTRPEPRNPTTFMPFAAASQGPLTAFNNVGPVGNNWQASLNDSRPAAGNNGSAMPSAAAGTFSSSSSSSSSRSSRSRRRRKKKGSRSRRHRSEHRGRERKKSRDHSRVHSSNPDRGSQPPHRGDAEHDAEKRRSAMPVALPTGSSNQGRTASRSARSPPRSRGRSVGAASESRVFSFINKEALGLPDARTTMDLRTSIRVLLTGDWFYKWSRDGREVEPRWVWVDTKSYLLAWAHRETHRANFAGSIRLEQIIRVIPRELVQSDEDGLPKSYYVLLIETSKRMLQLATEVREKADVWYEGLNNVLSFIRKHDISSGALIPD